MCWVKLVNWDYFVLDLLLVIFIIVLIYCACIFCFRSIDFFMRRNARVRDRPTKGQTPPPPPTPESRAKKLACVKARTKLIHLWSHQSYLAAICSTKLKLCRTSSTATSPKSRDGPTKGQLDDSYFRVYSCPPQIFGLVRSNNPKETNHLTFSLGLWPLHIPNIMQQKIHKSPIS